MARSSGRVIANSPASVFVTLFLIATALAADCGYAQTVLVKDINTTPASVSTWKFCKCGPYQYFAAAREDTGRELWRSDGTPAGTVLIKDIIPGSFSGATDEFACLNGSLLFAAYTQDEGSQLWKTDGSENGTQLIKDLHPGLDGTISSFLEFNGKLFFFDTDYRTGAFTLWSTDGTFEGTQLFKLLGNSAGTIIRKGLHNGGFYFVMSANNGYHLWRSDGTSGGTVIIKSSPWLYDALAVEDKIFFVESVDNVRYLMVSDGSPGNYTEVERFEFSFPQRFFALDNKLLFNANGIHITDGAAGNVIKLLDGSLVATTLYHGKFYGVGRGDGESNFFFTTDGTVEGTQNIMNMGVGGQMDETIPVINDKMVITSVDATLGLELFLTDGTVNGTTLLKDIAPGAAASSPSTFATVDANKMLFVANDNVHGREVWLTDGTAAGTILVKDVNPGTESSGWTTLATLPTSNNVIFFADNIEVGPKDLWQSDGTEAGTTRIYDFQSYASLIGTMDNDLILLDNKRLVRSDGTVGGTYIFKDLSEEIGSYYYLGFSGTVNVNGKFLFFFSTKSEKLNLGGEIWTTDGTDDGTFILKDINPGPGSSMQSLNGAVLGNHLIFGANDGANGAAVWMTDGTTEGTTLLKSLQPGAIGSSMSSFVAYKNEVYFAADDGVNGPAIWKTNGTTSGTQMVKSFSAPGNPSPFSLSVTNDILIFNAWTDELGWALWRSDGTAAGTMLVRDINASKEKTVFPMLDLISLNNRVYFSGNDGEHGVELWSSDGTTEGTQYVDLVPGTSGSYPRLFTAIENHVYFSAAGKLWRTESTVQNTVIASDIEPMSSIVYKNDWIYFIGLSDEYGRELFKFHYDDLTTSVVDAEDPEISLFPNPVSHTLQVRSDLTDDSALSVFDLRGTLLSSVTLKANSTFIQDVSQYPSGLYVVKVKSKDGIVIKKFLKK